MEEAIKVATILLAMGVAYRSYQIYKILKDETKTKKAFSATRQEVLKREINSFYSIKPSKRFKTRLNLAA